MQPTIAPLFNTRQAEHSLLTWAAGANINNTAEQPYLEYLSAAWQSRMFPRQNAYATFQAFWDSCLHDGVFEATPEAIEVVFAGDASAAAGKINQPSNAEMEIAFYETVNMGAGQYANNPWLMEMPDPLTRCVWGNYLAVPVSWNGGNSWTAYKDLSSSEIYGEADKVEVELNGVKQIVTAVRQFGQLPGTVSLALGYGREVVGKAGKNVGVNVQPWLGIDANGNTQYYAAGVTVSDSVDKEAHLACVQYHHTMGVSGVDPASGEKINVDEKTIATLGSGYQGALVDRSIIRRTTLKELPEFVEHLHEERHEAQELNSKSLYPGHEYKYNTGHHWAMYVDLNACTGCGACTVACMAENNVPIVGKREVSRHHEMTWLRIDRYFYGDYENPNVVYQPMLCQHCDNAPCENVCPVAATNHSSEGLNQMTYNRCIGTRYCANNCPYKVRRFNWLDYTAADLFPINQNSINGEDPAYYTDNLVRMVLNPDVTVRSRGVIEKCSFCVQRIQEGKLTAKREMRSLMDSDVRTACQTACPTGAIIFGDRNNKTGDLGKIVDAPLNYLMLEEINAAPSVFYSARVVNKEEEAMG